MINADDSQAFSLPIYLQISEWLTREIAAGHYGHGDRLPPEAVLAQTLDVAVGTLRKALQELEQRGLLERRQGSGNYVKIESAQPPASSVYGFFKLELIAGGGLPTAMAIAFDKVASPPHLTKTFVEGCYRLRRLRSLSGQPVALEEIYFDLRHDEMLTIDDMREALYLFYQQRLGFWISRVEDQIGAGGVPAWAPAGFAPPAGSVCPRIERLSWSGKNQIEEYSVTWFDSERCRYVNRLK